MIKQEQQEGNSRDSTSLVEGTQHFKIGDDSKTSKSLKAIHALSAAFFLSGVCT